MSDLVAPEGLGAGGSALWAATAADVEFEAGDFELLLEAARVKDRLDALAGAVAVAGPMLGERVHPAIVEARQQQLVLAKLIAMLRPSSEVSAASVSDAARHAASVRWAKQRRSA